MNEYTKAELSQMFGKPNWLQPSSTVEIEYLSGITFLDNFIKSFFIKSHAIFFKQYPSGLVIEFMSGFSTKRTGIKTSTINYIVLEHKDNILYKKDLSVVGGAIVGGLLLGPLGAVIGGMTGIGAKGTLGNYPDNILTISYGSKFIVFAVKNKAYTAIEQFFKVNFPYKYKTPNQIISSHTKFKDDKASEDSKIKEKNIPVKLSHEIKLLKELLDEGIITKEEFSKAKKKLLE